MTAPSIQRVHEGGAAEILVTEIAGIALNGPNDLVFHADGRLIFTDPGTYNPADPDPSYIFSIAPDGSTSLLVDFSPNPSFPTGSPSRPTARSCGTNPTPAMSAACGPTAPRRTLAACPATIPYWTA